MRASKKSALLKGAHSHDVSFFANSRGIALRAGHHCAQPLMRLLGIPSTNQKVDDAFKCVRSSICQGLDEGSLSPTLKALSGVHKFPQRIKCAVLPLETLLLALQSPPVSVSKKEL